VRGLLTELAGYGALVTQGKAVSEEALAAEVARVRTMAGELQPRSPSEARRLAEADIDRAFAEYQRGEAD